MAETTSTIVVYPLNGSNRRFTIPYEYLARRFISVTLMGKVGVQHKPLKMNSDFRFVTLNTIETTKAWGIQDGYETIEIRRETSATDRLVEFADGSVLRSRDLNVSAIQTIHIAEEARNLAATTLTTNDDGNLDARGRKIVNLAPATEDLDAVNFGQVKQWSGSALNQADRAEREANRSRDEANKSAASAAQAKASENAAKASQDAAKASQDAAKVSQTAAKASQDAAKVSENNAKASENAAKASQTAAKASQDASKTSENNAKASETAAKNAQAQAQKIADSVNENTDISKEQAEKAAKSATESAQSASASASSASKALASEKAAKASQDAAKAAQDAAEVSNKEAKEAAAGSKRSETVAVEKAAEATSAAETARGFSDAAASSVEAVHEHVNKAKDWAENPVNKPVEGNMYSAKHWASVAQGNVNGDNYLTKSGNLAELVDKEESRKNLGVERVSNYHDGGHIVTTSYTGYAPRGYMGWGLLEPKVAQAHTEGFFSNDNPAGVYRHGVSSTSPFGRAAVFLHIPYQGDRSATGLDFHDIGFQRGFPIVIGRHVARVKSTGEIQETVYEYLTTINSILLGTSPEAARKTLQLDPLVPMGGGKLSYQSHELANQQDIESVENKITLLNDAKADNTKVDEAVESINAEVAKKADKTALDSSVKSLNEAIAKKADKTALDSSVKSLNEAIAKKADQTALNATNTEVSKKRDASTMVALYNMHENATERNIMAPAGTDTYVFFNKSSFGLFSPTKNMLFTADCDTGAVWSKATGSFTDVAVRSDKRDKIDLKDIRSPLERVENLKGYTYKLLTSEGPKESAGVIAQDVLKVLPTAVGTSTNHNEEERYTVNYNSLTALLIEAVKELSAEVKHLKEVINNGSN